MWQDLHGSGEDTRTTGLDGMCHPEVQKVNKTYQTMSIIAHKQ
jgi:hypothetical protein